MHPPVCTSSIYGSSSLSIHSASSRMCVLYMWIFLSQHTQCILLSARPLYMDLSVSTYTVHPPVCAPSTYGSFCIYIHSASSCMCVLYMWIFLSQHTQCILLSVRPLHMDLSVSTYTVHPPVCASSIYESSCLCLHSTSSCLCVRFIFIFMHVHPPACVSSAYASSCRCILCLCILLAMHSSASASLCLCILPLVYGSSNCTSSCLCIHQSVHPFTCALIYPMHPPLCASPICTSSHLHILLIVHPPIGSSNSKSFYLWIFPPVHLLVCASFCLFHNVWSFEM